MTREIIETIEYGNRLTDGELDEAIRFYSRMEEGLRLLGPTFHLAWRPVHDTLQRLREMRRARPRSCNRHKDCDEADKRTEGGRAQHCHDSDCEDCFPK